MSTSISVDRWSKDHWSMLAYVETLCVDGKDGVGRIDLAKVRCNERRHPLQCVNRLPGWKPSYGTRLNGFFEFAQRSDAAASEAAGLQLTEHDDWDCLDDLNAAGFVETLSMVNGFVRMTKAGQTVTAQLREHKATGGMYANFRMPATA